MGKLYNLIKKYYDDIYKYQKDQENDYISVTKFNRIYKTSISVGYINGFVANINKNKDQLLPQYKNEEKIINTLYFDKYGVIQGLSNDVEDKLNEIENNIDEDKLNELINEFNDFKPAMLKDVNHPYDSLINDFKNDINKLNIDSEKKNEYIDSLDYANLNIVEKLKSDEVDKAIDYVSLTREKLVRENFEEYADKNNADINDLKEIDGKDDVLNFKFNNSDGVDILYPFINKNPQISADLKNKIKELDELVEEKKLFNDLQSGETDFKEYGFNTFFSKAKTINDLLANHIELKTDEEKIANLEKINKEVKELKEIEKKYDDVLGFIEQKFDVDKIGLPGNVYSGRVHSFENYKSFMPNLIPKWDNEKAPYGIILSGYVQLKDISKKINVPLDELLENPAKAYLKGGRNAIKDLDDFHIIKMSDDDNLGRRMAHILVMDNLAYNYRLSGYNYLSRGIEFLNNVDEFNDKTIENMTDSTMITNLMPIYDHSPSFLFGGLDPDYDSIKNLFALGNKTDNLFEVSTKYVDENLKRGEFAKNYDNQIALFKHVNPLNETRRILDTMKNFIVEKDILINGGEMSCKDGMLVDELTNPNTAALFVGAKQYYLDFLIKNNVDLSGLDKDQREEINDFINDPIKAFAKKYPNDPKLSKDINELKTRYKEEWDKYNSHAAVQLKSTFDIVNEENGAFHKDHDIEKILNDNKGGFFFRTFGKSSNEYKAVEKIVKEAFDPKSPSYGDYRSVKFFATKYVNYKLPQGVNEENLDNLSKKKVEFCKSLIETCDRIERVENAPVKEVVLASDNIEFQKQVAKDTDINLNMDNINIENNENAIENENVM